jgi:hypothetical protein
MDLIHLFEASKPVVRDPGIPGVLVVQFNFRDNYT